MALTVTITDRAFYFAAIALGIIFIALVMLAVVKRRTLFSRRFSRREQKGKNNSKQYNKELKEMEKDQLKEKEQLAVKSQLMKNKLMKDQLAILRSKLNKEMAEKKSLKKLLQKSVKKLEKKVREKEAKLDKLEKKLQKPRRRLVLFDFSRWSTAKKYKELHKEKEKQWIELGQEKIELNKEKKKMQDEMDLLKGQFDAEQKHNQKLELAEARHTEQIKMLEGELAAAKKEKDYLLQAIRELEKNLELQNAQLIQQLALKTKLDQESNADRMDEPKDRSSLSPLSSSEGEKNNPEKKEPPEN